MNFWSEIVKEVGTVLVEVLVHDMSVLSLQDPSLHQLPSSVDFG